MNRSHWAKPPLSGASGWLTARLSGAMTYSGRSSLAESLPGSSAGNQEYHQVLSLLYLPGKMSHQNFDQKAKSGVKVDLWRLIRLLNEFAVPMSIRFDRSFRLPNPAVSSLQSPLPTSESSAHSTIPRGRLQMFRLQTGH